MSAIVYTTLPKIQDEIKKVNKKFSKTKAINPNLAAALVEGGVNSLFQPRQYGQGDIRLLNVKLYSNPDGLPAVEYNFAVNGGVFRSAEMHRLSRKYPYLEIFQNQISIPFYGKSARRRGSIRIVAGTNLISLGSQNGNHDDFIYLSQQLEKIIKIVYKRNSGVEMGADSLFHAKLEIVHETPVQKTSVKQAISEQSASDTSGSNTK